MVYAHISHGLLDSPAGNGPVVVGRPAPGAARVLRAPGRQEAWGTSGVGLSWRTRWRMKPRASQPQNHSPCPPCLRALRVNRPEARSPVRFTVVRHVPGAGRRGRRPLPPILPRRGLAREGLAPPSARGVRTGPAREGPAPPSAWDVRTSRVRDATAGGTLLILR